MIKFGTKAETLLRLSEVIQMGKVLPQVAFPAWEWAKDSEQIIKKVFLQPWSSLLVVRSSAINEDTQWESQAGKYDSVLNVAGEKEFRDAVNQVLLSFQDENPDNQVLVQPMLKDVKLCGVAFTMDPNTGGSYYVINYDETGSTCAITSGNGEKSKLFYCFKGYEDIKNQEMKAVCGCLWELETLFGQDNLDVEFAISGHEIFILQVRALCQGNCSISRNQQKIELDRIAEKIRRDNQPVPYLHGRRTIFGVMPDWNPAEIIGIRPKPLSLSLYREIITDNIWAYQRNNYGYKNLRSFPLMVDFCGLPYIDVRISFNSFIPKGLDSQLSEKLTNYYLDRLVENPSKHDKVEFDIVFSCYTLDLPERIQVLKNYGFTKEEIESIIDALKQLTNNIIDNDTGLWKKDYEKIRILEKRYEEITNSQLDKVSRIYWLLEDCKRYGTLPFAGLARAGFVAVQFLGSLVNNGIILKEEYQQFMNSLSTVSTMMNQDISQLSKEAFLKKYGHLRPGTYDINSKRYDEAPDLYFDWGRNPAGESTESKETFRLSLEQMKKLKAALKEHGLSSDILGLFDFIKIAIEGREYSKFIFTKSLSESIRLFSQLGEENGFDPELCSYADIKVIQELYSSTTDVHTILNGSIAKGRSSYELTETITLPPLILEPEDAYSFYYPDTEPNFITMKRVSGEICFLSGEISPECIEGKIVLIQSADPGYDWIFSHEIKGFITKYGGANSHMAIRAGELGIPAVVGIGEKMFEQLKKGSVIEIDTLAKKVNTFR